MSVVLEVNSNHADKTAHIGAVSVCPPVGEDYWLFRVAVSKKQAVVGFRKFSTIGIGFQHEEDWNTNLPYTCETADIYDHIKHNRLGAKKDKCIAAIEAIQRAAAELKAGEG